MDLPPQVHGWEEDPLRPDPGTEANFNTTNNPFAFSPDQLGKMFDPDSPAAFYALGGLDGLEKGLRTDIKMGLSIDEKQLEGSISFEDVVGLSRRSLLEKPNSLQQVISRHPTAVSYRYDPTSFTDRKCIFGDGRLPGSKVDSIFKFMRKEYFDPVLLILTTAAIITIALGLYQMLKYDYENEALSWPEGVAVCVAIFIVVILGAAHDWRKEYHFFKLEQKNENRDRLVKVIRSGKVRVISNLDLLVGDVALFDTGDTVLADGILIRGQNVQCDESQATGATDIMKKTPARDFSEAHRGWNGEQMPELSPFIKSGAIIYSGRGSYLVTAVGKHSSYGKTMMAISQDYVGNTDTILQKKLNALTGHVAKIGLTVSLLLFMALSIKFFVQLRRSNASSITKGLDFLSVLIIAVTLVDVAVPSGLPLAMTVTLAFATGNMLRDKILVKNLGACETLEYTTSVCIEKTGLLTENSMVVIAGSVGRTKFGDATVTDRPIDPAGMEKESGAKDNIAAEILNERTEERRQEDPAITRSMETIAPEVKELLRVAIAITTSALEVEEDGTKKFIGSQMDSALLTFAQKYLGMGESALKARDTAQLVDTGQDIELSVTVLELGLKKFRMFVTGPAGIVIERCTTVIDDPKRRATNTLMTYDIKTSLAQTINDLGFNGLRTLGFAFEDFSYSPMQARSNGSGPSQSQPDRSSFTPSFTMSFLSILGIQDPLRVDAAKAVLDCQMAGIFVRLVTSDDILSAQPVAFQSGIQFPGGIIMEGPSFRRLTRRDRLAIIPRLTVLAQATGSDKAMLLRDLKILGETTAITGHGRTTDEINALKRASVVFGMNTISTDLAKSASSIILLDNSFKSMVHAIAWARSVGDSVRKFLQFQLTINITAVILTFVSSLISNSRQSVLNSVQLLWVNLIMDLFAILALATDPPLRSQQNRRPPPRSRALINVTM